MMTKAQLAQTELEKGLILSRAPLVGQALSFTACCATMALAYVYVPMWQIGLFFVAPYVLHKLAMCGAKKLDDLIEKQKEEIVKNKNGILIELPIIDRAAEKFAQLWGDADYKRPSTPTALKTTHIQQSIISNIVRCWNPAWPFFAAFLTIPMTTLLTPICASWTGGPFANPAKSLSVIIIRGAAYTVFMENADRIAAKAVNEVTNKKIKLEGKRSHAIIWQGEVPFIILHYTILQLVTPGAGLFTAAFTTRFIRSLMAQALREDDNTGRSVRIFDAAVRGLTYAGIYTGCSIMRNQIAVWLEAQLINTAFANSLTQASLTTSVLCGFLADYIYTVVKDMSEWILRALIYEPNMLLHNHYNIVISKIDGQIPKWQQKAVTDFDSFDSPGLIGDY